MLHILRSWVEEKKQSAQAIKGTPLGRIGGGMSLKNKKDLLESFLAEHSEKSKL